MFGNNDGERQGLKSKSQGRIKEPPLFLELNKKSFVLMHEFKDASADIIVCGHTHRPRIEKENSRIIINPGEACGWLYTRSSLVILDLDNEKPELIYF